MDIKTCHECGDTPALNTYDGAEGHWCDCCWEERVEEEERRFQAQRELDNPRPLTKQQQAWFDAYTGGR